MTEKKYTVEELLEKAYQPAKDAMKLHPYYEGKIQTLPKCAIRDFNDFAIWYSPGVAEPCLDIQKNPEKVYEHTNKWNTVAVVSDGTRVLGLGDIGPKAAMPVMEGKALLFKYLGGVDAVPLCLDTKDPDKIIETVKLIQPSFGGINLEDIAKPKCFYILDTLRADPDVEIPVWHDDQQGTACIVTAGLINALKVVGKKMDEVLVSMIGAGAANIAIGRVMMTAGVKPENMMFCDSKGILGTHRKDLEAKKDENPQKWNMCLKTNSEKREGDMAECMRSTDVCVAMSQSGPGVIKKEWVTAMATDAIMFPCANPIPEIWPWECKEAGARVVGTGRSDFENQVNNSLGFPGIFRGTLDVKAKTITDEMVIVAAQEIAKTAEDKGIHEGYIVPNMDEWEVFPREAVAVALKAIEQGIARVKRTKQELWDRASKIIKETRDMTQLLMKENFISMPPADL